MNGGGACEAVGVVWIGTEVASGVLSPMCKESFSVRGMRWPSLDRYLLGTLLRDDAAREAARSALDDAELTRVLRDHPRTEHWEATAYERVLLDGLRSRAAQSLAYREALAATGNAVLRFAVDYRPGALDGYPEDVYDVAHASALEGGEGRRPRALDAAVVCGSPREAGGALSPPPREGCRVPGGGGGCAPRCRLGQLLMQVRAEVSMPDYLPRELFDDLSTHRGTAGGGGGAGSLAPQDPAQFVTRLTQPLAEKEKAGQGDPTEASEKYERLFSCASDLLVMKLDRCRAALHTKRARLRETQATEGAVLRTALAELEAGERRIRTLEESLSHVATTTAATGKRLAAMDRQITRAREAAELVEHFDLFNAIAPDTMSDTIRQLTQLRNAQRRLTDMKLKREAKGLVGEGAAEGSAGGRRRSRSPRGSMDYGSDVDIAEAQSDDGGKADGRADDDDFDMDPAQILAMEDTKESIQTSSQLPSVFCLGCFQDTLEDYGSDGRTVLAVHRLTELVRDWACDRPGILNVKNYEAFLSSALLLDLRCLQHGLLDVAARHPAAASAATDDVFLTPLSKVTQLLADLGRGLEATEQYVSTVFTRATDALGPLVRNTSLDHRRLGNIPSHGSVLDIEVSSQLHAVFSKIEEVVVAEAPRMRRAFRDPSFVLRRLIDRFLQTRLCQQIQSELDAVGVLVAGARRVQSVYNTFGDISSLAGEVTRVNNAAEPQSPRSGAVMSYEASLPTDPARIEEVNAIIHSDLSVFCKKLATICQACADLQARIADAAHDTTDTTQHQMEHTLGEARQTYYLVEPECLDAYLCSRWDPHRPQASDKDVSLTAYARQAINATQEAVQRVQFLCVPPKLEILVEKLVNKLMEHCCRRIAMCVRGTIQAVREDLLRLPCTTPPTTHEAALDTIYCAMTVIEMIDAALREKFAALLSPSVMGMVFAVRRQNVSATEDLLGTAAEACCRLIAGSALSILLKQQKKTDYNPSGAGLVDGPSAACKEYCAYLTAQLKLLSTCLSSSARALDSAIELLSCLLSRGIKAHLTAHTVSTNGALRLKRDTTEYLNAMATLEVTTPAHLQPFETLQKLSNLVLVPADCLSNLLLDQLAEVRADDKEGFLKMRSDWKDVRRLNLKL